MEKTKLRTIFNIILVLLFFCYVLLIWVVNIGTLGVLIYWILFFGTMILKGFIAPKHKKEKNDNN